MPTPIAVLLPGRGFLAVDGPEARPFLQGLVSNNVDSVSPERSLYAGLLTAQGKFLHDFFLAEIAGAVVLDAEAERLPDLTRRLMMYRLRARATIADRTGDWVAAAMWDGDALGLEPKPGATRAFAGGIAFVDPRLPALGLRAILPRAGAEAALAGAGFTFAGPDAYDRQRLALGVTDGSRDIPVEKAFPLEFGFDDFHAVSYDKGCYVGQELTARTHNRGTIKRRIYPVTIEGPAPAPGTALHHGESEVGEMRSSRDGHGIAHLRIDAAEMAIRDGASFTAGPAHVTPHKPVWGDHG